ncbi:MAG: AbrB/MazE/SpoVT family DNA-binding domain-containing protein [Candidatus Pacebacteria bacterium]|nr:AbrB/MazE/SpoVT family DNA-binding domain-containing protein [Candidatus Paceibacterota bacterium]
MATKTKVQRISSKGQVTLPVAWRKAIKTELISVSISGDTLKIRPARLDKSIDDNGWETILDLTKVRKGGIPIDEVIVALEAMQAK